MDGDDTGLPEGPGAPDGDAVASGLVLAPLGVSLGGPLGVPLATTTGLAGKTGEEPVPLAVGAPVADGAGAAGVGNDTGST